MTQHTRLAVPVSERDHSQGPATAAVILVQYGDYECPYTRQSTTVLTLTIVGIAADSRLVGGSGSKEVAKLNVSDTIRDE